MQTMTSTPMMTESKPQNFSILKRSARSVQLVGDFTNWEAHPIPLRGESNGVWHTTVKLEPGTHYYRFLVDGQWYDDPECPIKAPNPFGGMNSVRHVN
jgi:1,4-alpha-glucan branching enzyme